jgi:hypothetical protein
MQNTTNGAVENGGVTTETLKAFSRRSGLGLTKIHELIRSREIDSFTVGKRRLVIVQSYDRFIQRQLEKQAA